MRVYTNEKGSFACVEGGTVVWYARSATETYTSTSCAIDIRKLGAAGEIIAGDFSATLTRATFHMVARRSE
jgi:hypothetical protein